MIAPNPSYWQDVKREIREALMALRLEVPEEVADDVAERVERLIAEAELRMKPDSA